MLFRVIKTVFVMLLCLAAMSITAYAYFTYSVGTNSGTFQAAVFETEIAITDQLGTPVDVTADEHNHIAVLESGNTYSVTLKHSAQSNAKTGFVTIEAVGCDLTYHTQQLGKDGDGNTETITFTLRLTQTAKVTFCANWGTSSYYAYTGEDNPLYVHHGDDVEITVAPPLNKAPVPTTTVTTTVTTTATTAVTTASTTTTATTTVATTTVTTTAATTEATTIATTTETAEITTVTTSATASEE